MSLRHGAVTAFARSVRCTHRAMVRSRKRHRRCGRLDGVHVPVHSTHLPPSLPVHCIQAYSTSGEERESSSACDISRKHIDTREYAEEIVHLFNSGGRDAGRKAERLLMEMEKASENNKDVEPPPTSLYNKVISMYGRTSRGHDAERILRHMFSRLDTTPGSTRNDWAQPNSVSFNACISAWAASRGGAMRAETLLREMIERHDMGDNNLTPDSHSFNAVIASYVRGERQHDRLGVIMQLMIQCSERPDSNVKVDTVTLSNVIRLLAKSRSKGAARQALAILERMEVMYERGNETVKPDGIAYSSAITALAKSGEAGAADKALQLFQRMELQYNKSGDFSVKPDTVTFNAVLDAFANSRERGSANKAQSLLQLMHHRYKAGNADVRPNTVSYATVMLAWKNSQDVNAADKAEALLRKLQELHRAGDECMEVNTICFSTVISAYSKVGTRHAAERAEALLNEMNELYAAGLDSVHPNAVTYTSVVEAWATTGDPQAVTRAEDIIRKMELASANNAALEPTTITFNTLIKAIEKSHIEDKARKAEKILITMRALNDAGKNRVKPTVRTYNAVMQACATTEGSIEVKENAVGLVLNLLQELRGRDCDVQPDLYTYPTALKACGNLAGNSNSFRKVFDFCCKDGMVNLMALNHVRRVAPGYLQKLVGAPASDIRLEHVPSTWTRRVRRKREK